MQSDMYSCALADVWALVVTFFNVLTGARPWNLASEVCPHYKYFVAFKHENYLSHDYPVSQDFQSLFKDALVENPDQRLTLRGVRRRLEAGIKLYPTRIRSGARNHAQLCEESAENWRHLQERASIHQQGKRESDDELNNLINGILSRGLIAAESTSLDGCVFFSQ
jgi:serine/threonine protein kinase